MARFGSTVLACSLVAGLPVAAVERASGEVVEVRVEGTRRYHEKRALGELATRPGMSREQALREGREDVAYLERVGPFTNVRKRIEKIAEGRYRIVFEVDELPYVGVIRIEGVSFFTSGTLEKKLTLQEGTYLNPLLLETDRQMVEQYLRDHNHPEARVTVTSTVDPVTNIASVTFQAELGPHVKVGDILYRGLPDAISRRMLNHHVLSAGNPRRALLNRPGGAFHADEVPWDAAAVAGALNDLGYLDATITEAEVLTFDRVLATEERAHRGPVLAPDGERDNRRVIVYHIDPGERYHLGEVTFILDESVEADTATERELRAAFELPQGMPYLADEIAEAKGRALAILREQGYARARFDDDFGRDLVIDLDARRVDLVLRLVQGRRYRVRRVDFAGNVITRDPVLRTAMALRPGELWSDSARRRSLREIARTGVFSNDPRERPRIVPRFETATPAVDDPNVDEVDVDVEVAETSTGSLRFNFGWSTASGFAANFDYTERNFHLLGLFNRDHWRGGAQTVKAGVNYDDDRQSVFAQWSDEHVMDSDYTLALGFARNESDYLDWDQVRHTSSITVGRRFLDNDLKLSASYRYTDLKIDDIDDDATDDAIADSYFLNTLGLRQVYDHLDHPTFPTRGFRVEFDQSLSGLALSASDEYLDIGFKASGFIPLAVSDIGGVTFLAISQRNQWLEPVSDSDQVPFYDRIYGGGPSPYHRGFNRHDLGPTQINRNGYEARPGGVTKWLTTFELSVPLQGTNDGFRAVAFTDVGNIWGEGESLDLDELRTAVGFGFRFPVRVLPVKLDFAWLLDPERDEDSFQTHFSISGYIF
ncbi:MAG: BamA/OMP85 family outer membrane protein [Planctomycetota bacterium]